jgi:hypothetical protein
MAVAALTVLIVSCGPAGAGGGGSSGGPGGQTTGVVEIADQTASPADRVVVDRVVSEGAGWIVIHEDDGGSLGDVVGQSGVSDGESTDVAVTLTRDAVDQETL